jgi:prevent-host-death family protein
MEWQLQHAKMKFSEVIKRAASEGPQTVTVHGKPTAMVLSIRDYQALARAKPKRSFTEALLSGPPWPDDMVEAINDRPRDLPRDIEL